MSPARFLVVAALLAVAPPALSQSPALPDAIADAVPAPGTPALSPEVLAGFRNHVSAYWLVPDDIGDTWVLVEFALTTEAKVVDGEVRLIAHADAPAATVEQAFQAARRAVLRALAQGHDLPPDAYDQWRDMQLTFDPSGAPRG